MRFFAAACILFGAAASFAQAPEVPHKIQFAGMTLVIRDDAQQEIQKDVEALTQRGRYYMLKVERAKTYFPIIEKILEEEHVPDDFKYLVLQESALVPDAVSVSNAVGFWQFKDFTALEMGLRVDSEIDERMNLVSATRAAARYLKQNNFYFNNWLYALQSYQMGAGGVKRAVGDLKNGARHMEINSETYWYVKKYLAHKVAFENVSYGEAQMKVVPYQTHESKSLKEIAEEVSSEESVLKEYNKWLKADRVPTDKSYVVLVPVGKLDGDFNKLVLSSSKASRAEPLANRKERENVKINGILSIRANSGETVTMLAERARVPITTFLRYNDIAIDHAPEPGKLYLLGKKKNKASETYCKVKPGDDLWSVSQRYGVRIKKLMKYNHVTNDQRLTPGSTFWLTSTRPEEEPVEASTSVEVAQLDEQETFDWYTKTTRSVESIPILDEPVPIQNVPDSTRVMNPPDCISGNKTYTVKQGDTFFSIAKQYSTPVSSLLSMNGMTIQQSLKAGQVLKIGSDPAGNPALTNVQTIVHEVKPTDTLYSIARQFGVTIKELLEWNNKKELTLTVGEKLRILQKL